MDQREPLLSAKTAFILIALFSVGTALGITAYSASVKKPLSTTMIVGHPSSDNSAADEGIVKNEIVVPKVYSSEKYGFDLEYPANWLIYKDNPDDIFIQPRSESENKLPIPHDGALEIKVTTLDPKTTFEDAVKKEQEKDGMSSTEEKVTIAGSSGVKITTKLCKAASCKVVEWFFPRGNELYHFSTIYPDLSYSPNFDKMISSFKFTDEGAGTEKLTGAELDKMLNGGVIPKSKIALNAKAPSDLKKLLADTAQKSAFPWCKGPVDLTYNFESVDLNGDGVREFVVTLLEACGSSVRGASGNGPIYVYQKKSGVWENTGDLGGSTYSIQNKKTDGYYDIMTYWHISCCSGTVDNYAWDNASSSYKKVSSKNVEIKESDNSN